MHTIKLLPTIIGLCIIMTLDANDNVDMDAIARQIAANNTSLAALSARSNAEIESIKAENNLPDPNVEFERQWGEKNIGNKWNISISQEFDWPGVYVARKKAADIASEAMQYLYKSNSIDKILEAKEAMIDIVYAYKCMSLNKEIMCNVDSMFEYYKIGMENGEVSMLDVNKLKIAQIVASRELVESQNSLNVAIGNLTKLNGGLNCDNVVNLLTDYSEETLYPISVYMDLAEKNNPQMRYNSLMGQSMLQRASAFRKSRFPGFNIGYSYEYEMGERFNGITLGITIPLFSSRHKSEAAKWESEAFSYELKTVKADIGSEIYSNHFQVVKLKEELDRYNSVFHDNSNMLLLKKALDATQITLLDYLQEMNYFVQAKRNYYDVQYQYHLLLARLNKYQLLN